MLWIEEMTLVLVIKLLMEQLSKPLSQSNLCNLIPDYVYGNNDK